MAPIDTPRILATREVLAMLFGPAAQRAFAVRLWDGSVEMPPSGTPPFTVVIRRPSALRRMLRPLTELSLAEAYIAGDVDIEGSMEAATVLGDLVARSVGTPRAYLRLLRAAGTLPATDSVDALGNAAQASLTGAATPRAARRLYLRGRPHTPSRDAHTVRFHYDVGNAFYQLWLDRRMVYSCAYFPTGDESLDAAQEAKLEHVCRKLRLRPGDRLLDIGCGWGGLLRYAAERYDVECVGITLSEAQAEEAHRRIAADGLSSRCRVEVRDYRTLTEGDAFDKIASIGMVEHVGHGKLPEYFAAAYRALAPGGLFLNHGIVTVEDARPRPLRDALAARLWRRDAFIQRYVFPDGRLVPLAEVIAAAEGAGFETRDMESLREHYATTLRHWVSRLETHEREAVELVGGPTYRIWRLYMAASARAFTSDTIGIVQTLLAKPDVSGRVTLPPTRGDLYQH